ncbi:uncharacterized protein ARMOST_19282 [Armillaria ostoyae]|uniref:Fungal-type protein kinase domain-containing protein n=1 Tax=Armillaria ostoyae TaxID=47428 RepID=A0A284S474_ARMOS|nr:uncharacterized protein ARMOST_19282 [Armillaria ostoyae]
MTFWGVPGGECKLHSPSHLHDVFKSIKSLGEYASERAYAQAINTAIQGVASELIPKFQFVLGKEHKDANATTNTVTDAFMYESNTKSSRDARGQVAGYASETLNAQHRKHLFSLFLGPDGVQFFKWERTYAVVSRAFDLAKEGKYLVEFLYQFCTLKDGDRGKDDTVTPATEEEIALAKEFLKPWIRPTDKDQRAFVKICVPHGTGYREVIAGPVIATPRSITGRATLGLPVYDLRTKTVMFLKDSWRDSNLPQESEILKLLNDAGVRNVPTLVCGGVLPSQQTTSHTYIKKDWNLGAHPTMTCQLTRLVYEAFLGHEEAFTKCRFLHRDVSGGNILIVYDKKTPEDTTMAGGRGLLNDWDMAIQIANLVKARQAERTGTWQFMSIELLRDRTKKHEPQDDFESFVYVMLFYGLCYLHHNEVGPELPNVISAIFDAGIEATNGKLGGNGKVGLVHGSGPLRRKFQFDCDPFNSWIKSTLAMIRRWQLHLNPPPEDETSADLKPAADTVKFLTHDGLKLLWEKMLAMNGWPSADAAHFYQLKPKGTKRPSVDEPQPVSKRQKSRHSSAAAPPADAETPNVGHGVDDQA